MKHPARVKTRVPTWTTEADNRAAKSGTVIVTESSNGKIEKLVIALGRTASEGDNKDKDLGRTTAVATNVTNQTITTAYNNGTFNIPANLEVALTGGNLTENLEIGTGATVAIPAGVTVKVEKPTGSGTTLPAITNNGTLEVAGQLIVGSNASDSDYVRISGNGTVQTTRNGKIDFASDSSAPKQVKVTLKPENSSADMVYTLYIPSSSASVKFTFPVDPVSSNYAISTPSRVTGGTVRVSPTSASEGNKVTITATPKSGYEVGSVTVTDKDGKQVTVTSAGDNKYTFTMPKSKVDVKVEFVRQQTQPTTPSTDFVDVPSGAFYADAVVWAVEQGITSGTSATTFSPNSDCTRAQIVTFLYRDRAS